MAQPQNQTQAFLNSIGTMLTEMQTKLEGNLDKMVKNHVNALAAELLTELNTVSTRLEAVEKSNAGVKARTKTKGEKKEGEPAKEGAAADAATPKKDGDADDAPAAGAKTGVKNKMLYFKDQYKIDAFKAELMAELNKVMPKFEETMNNDKSVSDKKNEAAKNTARASFIWKFLNANANCKEYLAKLTAQHEEYKKEQERKNKPAQNNADAGTPAK